METAFLIETDIRSGCSLLHRLESSRYKILPLIYGLYGFDTDKIPVHEIFMLLCVYSLFGAFSLRFRVLKVVFSNK